MKKILRFALGLVHTTIESVEIADGSILVKVRPHKRYQHRCPHCNKAAPVYDAMPCARRWRTLDLGGIRCHLEYHLCRVACPEHGVHVEDVPWARPGSWFTRGFEDEVAWLSVHCTRSVVAELMRIDWKSVGSVCRRVHDDLEADHGSSRFDGLVRIGVDETSYKKGHKYMTIVVDHDRNRVVWAAKGHGKAQLDSFFSMLSPEQRASIRVVSADGARWIADAVDEWCPSAVRVMDPFHVVSWATDALDELRKQAWRDARKGASGSRAKKRGRPRTGEERPPDKAKRVKGARFPLLKNPEDLTEAQASTLAAIAREDKRLYRGYLLKERLRDVFKAADGDEAAARLDSWLASACRSRIPEFVELSRKVRRRRDSIIAAVECGISNARVEAINNKIKVTIRMGYGFRNIDNLIALIMLRCSDLKPTLPGRAHAA